MNCRLSSLDHLVGRGQQRLRDGKAEGFGSFEVHSHLAFFRKLHRDDLAPLNHSITLVASASSLGGTSKPIVLAVCKLTRVQRGVQLLMSINTARTAVSDFAVKPKTALTSPRALTPLNYAIAFRISLAYDIIVCCNISMINSVCPSTWADCRRRKGTAVY